MLDYNKYYLLAAGTAIFFGREVWQAVGVLPVEQWTFGFVVALMLVSWAAGTMAVALSWGITFALIERVGEKWTVFIFIPLVAIFFAFFDVNMFDGSGEICGDGWVEYEDRWGQTRCSMR